MNKILKLIWVNILGLFDINKIIIARNDGVKSNLEKKSIITGIIVVVYGFLLYKFFMLLKFSNTIIVLNIGFIVSSLLCFFLNLSVIEPLIFKSDDNEMLFAMPVTRTQILFSKLFAVYLKSLVYIVIIMFSSLMSYVNLGGHVDDTFGLMFILITLIIPFIPLTLATLFAYLDDVLKVKSNNSKLYKFIKIIFILGVIGLLILYFKGIDFANSSELFLELDIKLKYLYPFLYLFEISLSKANIIAFILLLGISILAVYVYGLLITNNYLKICSMLKGIKKKNKFVYKKKKSLHKVGGLFRKELITLFNNKFYLSNSFGTLAVCSLLLFFIVNLVNFDKFLKIEHFDLYLNLYLPTILSILVTISTSTISSMSLEKDNMKILGTMPISIGNILFSKWAVNIVIGSIFVFVNGTIVSFYLNLDKWGIFFNYLIPFISLLFVSLTSLILDYRFIEKDELDDNSIIKQRLIGMIPMFLSIIIGLGPFFIPVYKQYKLLLGSYVVAMIIGMMIEHIYLILNRKKLYINLFN